MIWRELTRTSFKRSALITAFAVGAFLAEPAQAEWLRAETDHFIVYGDTSESSLRRYAQRVERFDALLRTYYPIATDYETPKLEIFLAEGRRDMRRVSPGIGAGVAGYYSPNSGRIYAVVDTRSPMGDVVVYHEYAHHFMFQMRANAYPSWFVEGFAEYYSTADVTKAQPQFGRHNPGRMNSLTSTTTAWADMKDVLKWRVPATGRYPAHLYYAQSWAMTHYFMSTPERTQALGRYLTAVVNGQDSVDAMQAATGRTSSQLQDDVRRYVSGAINMISPQIQLPDAQVAISRLSRVEADSIWLDVRLDNTPVEDPKPDEVEQDAQTEAQKARQARQARDAAEHKTELIQSAMALGERHADDEVGRLLTARAQRLAKRPDLALDALAPIIDAGQANADVLRVAALALLDQAKTEASVEAAQDLRRRASAYLGRAMDRRPLDFRIYLALNDTRRVHAGYPNDNDVTTLEVAYALAPQSFETRLRLGQAYMSRQMNTEAIAVLTAVSNSPHSSSYKRIARNLIGQAREAMGQAPLDESSGPEGPEDEADDSDL